MEGSRDNMSLINSANSNAMEPADIPMYRNPTRGFFQTHIQNQRKPALLKDVAIGSCIGKWNCDYLINAVGPEKSVSVHESSSSRLRFVDKNFAYKVIKFDDFIRRAKFGYSNDGEPKFYYYRALADDARKTASDFRRDFPGLTEDFIVPEFVESELVFSCVLRCGSGDLGLWLHYDVLDNILVQVVGRKRAVLFDPEHVEYLYLEGDKSRIHDPESVDLKKFPLFANATPHVCVMEPGDILFIPAFWMHYMVSEEFSIAVNIFWYNLPKELYDNKDTYGNKELVPFQRALQGVDRALKQLENLPSDIKRFYARLLRSRINKFLIDPTNFTT